MIDAVTWERSNALIRYVDQGVVICCFRLYPVKYYKTLVLAYDNPLKIKTGSIIFNRCEVMDGCYEKYKNSCVVDATDN